MNNKTIIEFDFRWIWRVLQISEGFIHLKLQNSSYSSQPHSIIAKYSNLVNQMVLKEPSVEGREKTYTCIYSSCSKTVNSSWCFFKTHKNVLIQHVVNINDKNKHFSVKPPDTTSIEKQDEPKKGRKISLTQLTVI